MCHSLQTKKSLFLSHFLLNSLLPAGVTRRPQVPTTAAALGTGASTSLLGKSHLEMPLSSRQESWEWPSYYMHIFWERSHHICSFFFFWKLGHFFLMVILLILCCNNPDKYTHSLYFASCYCSPSVELDSPISATNEYKTSSRKGKKKQLTVGTPLGKANWQSGIEIKPLIFYAFIYDMPVRIASLANFASRKKSWQWRQSS